MFKNFEVGGGLFYVGEYYADAANQNQIPAYTRIDVMASYRIDESFALQFNMQNLFNKQYFEGSGGNVIPGAARTVPEISTPFSGNRIHCRVCRDSLIDSGSITNGSGSCGSSCSCAACGASKL